MPRRDNVLKGSIVALVTPFNINNKIDFNCLNSLVEFHVFEGTDALVLLGTTSESSTLTKEEKDELVKFVINVNAKRMKIIVAVIANSTQEAIVDCIRYERMGADYLLVVAPYYIKPNRTGLIKHFRLTASSVNTDIIIYNIPSRCGINIGADILKELKKSPNIIGVKESNKDINHIMDVIELQDKTFGVYCGNDDLSYLFLSLGSPGLINVFGNLEPKVIKNLINIYNQNPYLGLRYFYEYYNMFKLIFIDTNPIPIKALMNYIGIDVGTHRLPLDILDFATHNHLVMQYKMHLYQNKII